MAVQQINISRSVNGIPLWGPPFSSGKKYLLTQNVGVSVAIPAGVNQALLTYSAGASVQTGVGAVGYDNSLATDDSGEDTVSRWNVQMCPVQQFDTTGAQQYLHMISPNPADYVTVTFYNGAI